MNTKIYYLFIFLLGFINTSLLGQEKNDEEHHHYDHHHHNHGDHHHDHEHGYDDDGHDHEHAAFFCGDTIHGIPTLPLLIEECEQTTAITSLQEDGVTGTVVYGSLDASQIRITPGHTFVRIISPPNDVTRRHTTTRFRRRNRGRSVRESSATITEAILPVKKSDKPTENIKIFPNPFSDVLQMTSEVHPIVAYEIQDLYGKTIRKKTVEATHKQAVSVSDLEKGMYLLSLYFQNESQKQQTIIKQ